MSIAIVIARAPPSTRSWVAECPIEAGDVYPRACEGVEVRMHALRQVRPLGFPDQGAPRNFVEALAPVLRSAPERLVEMRGTLRTVYWTVGGERGQP